MRDFAFFLLEISDHIPKDLFINNDFHKAPPPSWVAPRNKTQFLDLVFKFFFFPPGNE